MGRHSESAWLVLGLLFVSPIASMANGLVVSNAFVNATATVPTSDYIFVDSFEPAPDCSLRLTCAAPAPGKSCVSGRLIDAGSGNPLRALFRADLSCGSGAIGGPCDLSVKAYDAVQFASNPLGSAPLPVVSTTVDGCGRFRFGDITPPTSGIVALVTDDADLAAESNLRAPTAEFQPLGTNAKIDDVNALSVRNDTLAQWTASAGSPFGANSFADVGAILLYFTVGGVGRPGVTVAQNGNAVPANDYYFSDASPLQRVSVDSAQTSTGANGSALFVNAGSVANYSGTGAEPLGCTWPSKPGASIIGVVLFIEIDC